MRLPSTLRFPRREAARIVDAAVLTRAQQFVRDDIAAAATGRPFSHGGRPVMRWVKGDGLDDDVTRAALLAATRQFGSAVDYCLCTNGLDAARVRDILSWAEQPVEWWPLTPEDNPELTQLLTAAGAEPTAFGYWWKWYPERVRPAGPEWILDGDMVVLDRPSWFSRWVVGADLLRISAEDSDRHRDIYGDYAGMMGPQNDIYSGLVSLPPAATYMPQFATILTEQPLVVPHDGRQDMSEQGVVAVAFERLGARTFPLSQFPFARAFESDLDHGSEGDRGITWGYHFGHSFRGRNPHFERMVAEGGIPSKDPSVVERFTWLGGFGQWGAPGWSVSDECANFILSVARQHKGRQVLEIGTSRGHLTAMLDAVGCRVTTVDHVDRGAGQNLSGTAATVVQADGREFLADSGRAFDLIVIDRHGNSEEDWRSWAPVLTRALRPLGRLLITNLTLADLPEWRSETGVAWLVEHPPRGLRVEQRFEPVPGVVVLRRV